MISDRELSALVATKVMGWSLRENCNREVGGSLYCDPSGSICTGIPSFATDAGLALEAAMKEADKHGAHNYGAKVTTWRVGKLFGCSIHSDTIFVGRYGRTLARACCLAALRAAGVEVKDDADSGEGGQR